MRLPLTPGGLFNSENEAKTPFGKAFAIQNASVDQGIWQVGSRYVTIGSRPNANAADVCYGIGYGKFTTNATHKLQITGTPTGGSVIIRSPVQGATNSAAIAYNAYPSDVLTAIAPWTSFDDGELVFSGGPFPNEPIFATYKGRYAGIVEALLTLQTNNLTGGTTPTLAISSFVTGGLQEVYLVVVQPSGTGTSTLYAVTSTDGFATTTWTSVATGLTSSEWYFEQLEDKIYGANATDGIAWYQLGGSWSGTAGIPSVQNPAGAPTAPTGQNWNQNADTLGYDFTGSAIDSQTGWGVNPTITGFAGGFMIRLNAAITNATVVFRGTLPGFPVDWSHADFIKEEVQIPNPTLIQMDPNHLEFTISDTTGTPVVTTPNFEGAGNRLQIAGDQQMFYTKDYHFGSLARVTRSISKYVTFTFFISLGTNGQTFYVNLQRRDTWPNDMMQTLNMLAGPTIGTIDYAYTYQKASTGVESKLSPTGRTVKLPPARSLPLFGGPPQPDGCNIHIAAPGNSQLTTGDYVNFYRRDRFGQWRFIGQSANATSGQVTFTDKNMLDELDNYPVYGTVHLPGGYLPYNIGIWKECLVVDSDRKVFVAKTGYPTIFAPDPTNAPAVQIFETAFEGDPNAPRTVFLDASRSQDARTIVGQDHLFLAGQFNSFAMVDSDGTPNGLSPPRPLPGSRGALGTRAGFKHAAGVNIPAVSGLWYYDVGFGFSGTNGVQFVPEEISKEIRSTWNTLFGASPSNVVGLDFNEETWVFAGTQYVKWTRNGKIEQGTFADSVKAAIGNQANGLIFATTKGSLMRFGSQTTDNGTDVAWSWATGKMDNLLQEVTRTAVASSRLRINGIVVTAYSGTPYVLVECWDGNAGLTSQRFDIASSDKTINFYPARNPLIGSRVRITVGGIGSDSIDDLFLEIELASKGAGN